MNVSRGRHRIFVSVSAITAMAALVSLLVQNRGLRARLRDMPEGRSARIEIGDSVRPLTFVTPGGEEVLGSAVVTGNQTLLVFYARECEVCQQEWPQWEDLLVHAGSLHVVFVDVARSGSWTPPPLSPLHNVTFLRASDGRLNGRIGGLPTVLLTDTCGVVSAIFHSVRQIGVAREGPSR